MSLNKHKTTLEGDISNIVNSEISPEADINEIIKSAYPASKMGSIPLHGEVEEQETTKDDLLTPDILNDGMLDIDIEEPVNSTFDVPKQDKEPQEEPQEDQEVVLEAFPDTDKVDNEGDKELWNMPDEPEEPEELEEVHIPKEQSIFEDIPTLTEMETKTEPEVNKSEQTSNERENKNEKSEGLVMAEETKNQVQANVNIYGEMNDITETVKDEDTVFNEVAKTTNNAIMDMNNIFTGLSEIKLDNIVSEEMIIQRIVKALVHRIKDGEIFATLEHVDLNLETLTENKESLVVKLDNLGIILMESKEENPIFVVRSIQKFQEELNQENLYSYRAKKLRETYNKMIEEINEFLSTGSRIILELLEQVTLDTHEGFKTYITPRLNPEELQMFIQHNMKTYNFKYKIHKNKLILFR